MNQWVPKETEKTEEKSVRAELMKPLKILYAKVNRNRALKAKCVYRLTPNQDVFMHLFPGYGPMGLGKKQGCREIERTGSKRPIQAGLIGSGATDFFAPWTVGCFTVNVSIISNQGD